MGRDGVVLRYLDGAEALQLSCQNACLTYTKNVKKEQHESLEPQGEAGL